MLCAPAIGAVQVHGLASDHARREAAELAVLVKEPRHDPGICARSRSTNTSQRWQVRRPLNHLCWQLHCCEKQANRAFLMLGRAPVFMSGAGMSSCGPITSLIA